jgi:histone deacetylase complex regulatory component SIN3
MAGNTRSQKSKWKYRVKSVSHPTEPVDYTSFRTPTIEEIRKVFEHQIRLSLFVNNNNEPICKGMV